MEQVTPAIDMKEVESSQIHSIGHDAESSTLAIRFRDRRTNLPTSLYHYSNVPVADFEAFRDAESKGSHFGKHIKPHDKKYPYVKVDAAPAA
ncbi:hypothetical protein HpMS107_60540 [Helicobacter pylori]